MFATPFVYIFFYIYVILIFFLSSVQNFIYFWLIMEFSTILFMGLGLSVSKSSFSFFLVFYIIQSISAFMLFLFYLTNLESLFSMSLFMKLAMFPFHFWFSSIMFSLENVLFFLSSTIFKIPSFLIVANFPLLINVNLFFISMIFTLAVGGVSMVFMSDLRTVLVSSAIANNSWMMLSVMVGFWIFILFMSLYSMALFFIMKTFMTQTKFNPVVNSADTGLKSLLLFFLLFLSGMPPFPIFFVKIFSYYKMVLFLGLNYLTILYIFFSVLMVLGYMKVFFNLVMMNYSCFFYNLTL